MSERAWGELSYGEIAPEDAAVARLVARLSSEYFLRALQLTIEAFGDVRAGMLVQAVHAANLAPFNARAEDWGRHAVRDVIFPDDLRRPISVGRLAASTGLPFETVRRTVRRLIDSGICARVKDGVIVPMTTEQRPGVVVGVMANVGYARRLLRDLHAAGFIGKASSDTRQTDTSAKDTVQARHVARLSEAYLLRAHQLLMDSFGDIRDGIVAQTIITANTSHLDTRGGEGRRYASIDTAPPDEVRRPISIAGVAQSTGLPFETTRRHVRRLLDANTCVRLPHGVIVPQTALSRPNIVRAALANVGYIRKFARELLAAGV